MVCIKKCVIVNFVRLFNDIKTTDRKLKFIHDCKTFNRITRLARLYQKTYFYGNTHF